MKCGPFCLRSSTNKTEIAGLEPFLYLGLNKEKIDELSSIFGKQKLNQNLHTLTLGFDEFKGTINDETVYAKEVANLFNTSHTSEIIDKDLFEANIAQDSMNEFKLLELMQGLDLDQIFKVYKAIERIFIRNTNSNF